MANLKFTELTAAVTSGDTDIHAIVQGGVSKQATGAMIKGPALASISGLTTAANKMIYATASNVYAVADLTVFARTILDDADAATARATLELAIGTNVQAYDAGLLSIAGLTTEANKMIYATASDTYSVADLTVFARSILDDGDAATARATLELGAASSVEFASVLAKGPISGEITLQDGIFNQGLSEEVAAIWTKIEIGAGIEVVQSIAYLGNGIVLCGTGNSADDGDIYKSIVL